MADNIGTITVAIEAQTEDLKRGLASAEKAVKDSAQKMEQATEGLSAKAEKSWTEFASKMGVIQQVAGIAQQAWNALDGVLTEVTNTSSDASQKLTGSLNAIEQASIPIVSQFLAIGRGIYDWISGEKQLRKEIEFRNKMQMKQWQKEAEERKILAMHNKDLQTMTDTLLKRAEEEMEMRNQATDRDRLRLKLERQRIAIREIAEKKMAEAHKISTQEVIDADKKRFEESMRAFKANQMEQLEAFDQMQADKSDKETRARRETEKENTRISQDEEKKRIAQTLSLENQLAIMVAKQEGDEEKARILAIEARYRAMSVGATKAQQESIDAMKAIELAGISATGGDSGTGGTATITTAVGGFTVASGAMERKKQTSLLKRIADATEKLSAETSSAGIIPPR